MSAGTASLDIIPDLSGFGSKLTSALGGFTKTAERSTKQLGKAMAVGLGAGIVGVGVGLAKVGSDFDKAYDTIRVGTGATGKSLDGLKSSFKNVLSSVPADFGDAGSAIADLNTRLGVTGKPLEGLSKQFLELSRITKTDVGTNIESVTRALGDAGIPTEEMSGALDKMYRASQATGPPVQKLTTLITKFGSPMRQLGFSFEETLAMVGKFEKEGVNTELVMGSMRIALGKMSRDGEPVQETFKRVTEEIKNAGSAGEANALALELFGARAGPDMASAIREGRFEIGDLVDTISNGDDTILGAAEDTRSLGESFKMLTNKVLVKLEPIAIRVFDSISSFVDGLIEGNPKMIAIAATIGTVLVGAFLAWAVAAGSAAIATLAATWPILAIGAAIALVAGGLIYAYQNFEWFQNAVNAVANFIADHWREFVAGFLIFLIGPIGAGLLYLYLKFDWFRAAVAAVWAGIQAAVRATVDWIAGTVVPWVTGTLVPALVTAWQAIAAAAVWAWDNVILPAVRAAVAFFQGVLVPAFQWLWQVIQVVWDGISAAVVWAWQNVIQPAVSAIVAFFTGVLVPAFQTLWQWAQVVWDGISAAVVWAWQNVIQPAVSAIVAFFTGVLVPAFNAFMAVAQVVWAAISAAISWVWNNIIQPAFTAIRFYIENWLIPIFNAFMAVAQVVWAAISAAISWVWNNIIQPVWNAIRTFIDVVLIPVFNAFMAVAQVVWSIVAAVIRDVWEIVRGIFDAIVGFVQNVLGPAFRWLLDAVIIPVWNGIVSAITGAWNFVIKPLFDGIKWFLENVLAPAFRWLFDSVVKPVMDGIGDTISFVWDKIIKPVFDAMWGFVKFLLTPVWEGFSGAAKAAWDAIPGIIRGSLKVVGAIVGGFLGIVASIADAVGLDHIAEPLRKGADAAGTWGTYAKGGYLGARGVGAGFVTDGPRAIVGEGNQAHPEYVIPTDPRYRKRAVGLYESLGGQLLAAGGVIGKVGGLDPDLLTRLQSLANAWGGVITVNSGRRDSTKQAGLYADYLAGRGPLAAKPGTSLHERGLAADISPGRSLLGGMAAAHGLVFSVPSEDWHITPISAGEGSGGGGNILSKGIDWAKGAVGDALGVARDVIAGQVEDHWPKLDVGRDLGGMVPATVNALRDKTIEIIRGKADEIAGAEARSIPGGTFPTVQIDAWIGEALRHVGISGYDARRWASGMFTLVMRESGGDPNAVNRSDSNAAAGTPSMGITQVIQPTFDAYKLPGLDNILDPVHNLVASIRYIMSRWGDIANVQQANPNMPAKGYAAGGILPTDATWHVQPFDSGGVLARGLNVVDNTTGGPEALVPAGGPLVNIERYEQNDGVDAAALAQRINQLVGPLR